MPGAPEILDYWFGTSDDQLTIIESRSKLWWSKDESTDTEIRLKFGSLLDNQIEQLQYEWSNSIKGKLALIILTDQFSRNIYRNQARAFSMDKLALELCLDGLEQEIDKQLMPVERVFFYLPLEHSENITHQNKSVTLFKLLQKEVPDDLKGKFTGFTEFAEKHREIIAKYGRFPHRNRILGRESTNDELTFLKTPGSSF